MIVQKMEFKGKLTAKQEEIIMNGTAEEFDKMLREMVK